VRGAVLRALLACALGAVLASDARAQEEGFRCTTYDRCALRLEGAQLLRGADGVPVARLGLLSGRLAEVEWSSDSASRLAARFRANYESGRMLQGVAIAVSAFAAVLVIQDPDADSNRTAFYSAALVSTALGAVGRRVEEHGRRQLSRALWWHNRDFAR
jgi:hypothetical protein